MQSHFSHTFIENDRAHRMSEAKRLYSSRRCWLLKISVAFNLLSDVIRLHCTIIMNLNTVIEI